MNRLADASSPYLLQHADNPVDWHEWGEEAFTQAKEADKPIFLSVGYSSCHWCHVMAHESFEDAGIAAYVNEHFVSVKVRPETGPAGLRFPWKPATPVSKAARLYARTLRIKCSPAEGLTALLRFYGEPPEPT